MLFGLPANFLYLRALIEAEQLYHASGTPTEQSPEWHCYACHNEWGVTHLAPLLRSFAREDSIRNEEGQP